MMTLLAMPPGDMSSCAAILLVVDLGEFVRVEIEAAMRLVVVPGLTDALTTMEVEVLAVPLIADIYLQLIPHDLQLIIRHLSPIHRNINMLTSINSHDELHNF